MIGSLRGRIASKLPPQLTVEVGGVGYELEAPMSTFFHLPAVGAEVQPADAPGGARGRPRPVRLWHRGRAAAVPQPHQGLRRRAEDRPGAAVRHQRRGLLPVRARAGHRRAHARPGHRSQDRRAADRGDARPPGGSGPDTRGRHLRSPALPAPRPRRTMRSSPWGTVRRRRHACSRPPVPVHTRPRN